MANIKDLIAAEDEQRILSQKAQKVRAAAGVVLGEMLSREHALLAESIASVFDALPTDALARFYDLIVRID